MYIASQCAARFSLPPILAVCSERISITGNGQELQSFGGLLVFVLGAGVGRVFQEVD